MESLSLMGEGVRETILRVNVRLAELLEEAKRALRGKGGFGVEEVRKIRQPVEEMAAIDLIYIKPS